MRLSVVRTQHTHADVTSVTEESHLFAAVMFTFHRQLGIVHVNQRVTARHLRFTDTHRQTDSTYKYPALISRRQHLLTHLRNLTTLPLPSNSNYFFGHI